MNNDVQIAWDQPQDIVAQFHALKEKVERETGWSEFDTQQREFFDVAMEKLAKKLFS